MTRRGRLLHVCCTLIWMFALHTTSHLWTTNHFGHSITGFDLFVVVAANHSIYHVKLWDGKLHEVPLNDVETLAGLGVNTSDAVDAATSTAYAALRRGDTLQTMRLQMKSAHDYDEVMRAFVARVVPLQYPLDIHSVVACGPMINPSLTRVPITNQLLILAGPVVGGYSHRAFKMYAEGFAVLSANDTVDVAASRRLFGDAFDVLMDPNGPSRDRWLLHIIDARMVPLPDGRVRLFYSNAYDIKNPKMFFTTVQFANLTSTSVGGSNGTNGSNGSNGTFGIIVLERAASLVHANSSGKQKNWSPFVYHGRVLLVHSIRPWHVVAMDDPDADNATLHVLPPGEVFGHLKRTVTVQTIHLLTDAERTLEALGWGDHLYGTPRGGTPAVLLPPVHGGAGDGTPQLYILVFHTRALLKSNINYSYFMGALTFCASPPFHIYSVSRVPMVGENWYEGAWAGRALDYVFFPTGLLIERRRRARGGARAAHNGTTAIGGHTNHSHVGDGVGGGVGGGYNSYDAVISVGRQDSYGAILRIGLRSILQGMVRVRPECPRS